MSPLIYFLQKNVAYLRVNNDFRKNSNLKRVKKSWVTILENVSVPTVRCIIIRWKFH